VAELSNRAEHLTDQLLSTCWTCPKFAEIRARAMGRRTADRIVFEILNRFAREAQKGEKEAIPVYKQMSILEEVSTHLEYQGDLEETLRLILTGITAGESLRFNLAFLFLVDERTQTLRGQMAVGPADAEEAGRVWQWITERGLTLKQMMEKRIDSGGRGDQVLTEQVRGVKIPLTDEHSVLVRAVCEKRTFHIEDPPDGDVFLAQMEAPLVVVPLLSGGQTMGGPACG